MHIHNLLKETLVEYDVLARKPDIEFNMDIFHSFSKNKCVMCLGGAYLHTNGYAEFDSREQRVSELPHYVYAKINTLDALRTGRIRLAYIRFYASEPASHIKDMLDVSDYRFVPEVWRADMDQVLARLKEYKI